MDEVDISSPLPPGEGARQQAGGEGRCDISPIVPSPPLSRHPHPKGEGLPCPWLIAIPMRWAVSKI